MDHLVALTSPGGRAHAAHLGDDLALCGSRVVELLEAVFPGGASSVCRECVLAAARADSTVPVFSRGPKRPGGMG